MCWYVLLVFPAFYLQDPIFTLLPYPGDVMDRRMGNTEIPGEHNNTLNDFVCY
jgi:hypothetical protein